MPWKPLSANDPQAQIAGQSQHMSEQLDTIIQLLRDILYETKQLAKE